MRRGGTSDRGGSPAFDAARLAIRMTVSVAGVLAVATTFVTVAASSATPSVAAGTTRQQATTPAPTCKPFQACVTPAGGATPTTVPSSSGHVSTTAVPSSVCTSPAPNVPPMTCSLFESQSGVPSETSGVVPTAIPIGPGYGFVLDHPGSDPTNPANWSDVLVALHAPGSIFANTVQWYSSRTGSFPSNTTGSAAINLGVESQTGSGNDFTDSVDFVAVGATYHLFSASPVPDLTITKSHQGTFAQGQQGASYTITATNSGELPTTQPVTVTDTLPAGLTATAMSGTGWTCTIATVTCTRSDALAAGASYPPITLTVNVAATAPASVTNTATVAGGGEVNPSNDTATDPTVIAVVIAPRFTG